MQSLLAFLVALIFGLGLAIARLTNPERIIGFLDFAGDWYPGPLVVIGTGVCLYAAANLVLAKRARPVLSPVWHLPTRKDIDGKLVVGALVFGCGWGLAGYCPGPAFTGLAFGKSGTLIFTVAMLLGALVEPFLQRLLSPPTRGEATDCGGDDS